MLDHFDMHVCMHACIFATPGGKLCDSDLQYAIINLLLSHVYIKFLAASLLCPPHLPRPPPLTTTPVTTHHSILASTCCGDIFSQGPMELASGGNFLSWHRQAAERNRMKTAQHNVTAVLQMP